MMTHDAHPLFPYPAGFGTPGRRPEIASRAAQTLGIKWRGSMKRGLEATARTLVATRNTAELPAIQSANLQRAGARGAARSAMTTDQIAALTADLPRRRPALGAAGSQ